MAAINMLYGASAVVRCMTASSGPGISLMQEGLSCLAGAELPCVRADITRGGTGLGNMAAELSDYNQVVKVGGHGNYRTIALAPHRRPIVRGRIFTHSLSRSRIWRTNSETLV